MRGAGELPAVFPAPLRSFLHVGSSTLLLLIFLILPISPVKTTHSVYAAKTDPAKKQQPSLKVKETAEAKGSVHITPMRLVADAELYAQALQLSWFDASMEAGMDPSRAADDAPVTRMMEEIKELEREYLEDLKDHRSSYGVYATGEFDLDYLNSETRYSAGVRWKLFNDGYYEAIREDAKKVLQTQLEFFQLKRDMRERKLEDDLYALFTYENLVNLQYYQAKADALVSIHDRRRQQLEYGYTTQVDVIDIKRQLEKSRHSLEFYQQTDFSKLPVDEARLLNQVENLTLKSEDELMNLTGEQSFDLKIQDNFIERSEFFPTWAEDLRVNLHTLYRQEFDEENRSIVGVEVELPLSFDSDRRSLIDTQKRIYHYQKQAIRYRLHQQLAKLKAFFDFQKNRLLTRQDDIEIVLLKSQHAASEDANVIQNLENDPARTREMLEISLLDARYDALMIRLKIYEIILKLTSLTQVEDITFLFEFD